MVYYALSCIHFTVQGQPKKSDQYILFDIAREILGAQGEGENHLIMDPPEEQEKRKPRKLGSYAQKPGPKGLQKNSAVKTSAKDAIIGKRSNLTLQYWITVFAFVDSHPALSQHAVVEHFASKTVGALIFTQATLSRKVKDREKLEGRVHSTPNAQVKHEHALKSGEVVEVNSDSEDESEDKLVTKTPEIISLCQQLETPSLNSELPCSLELLLTLRHFRVQLVQHLTQNSKQATLDSMWRAAGVNVVTQKAGSQEMSQLSLYVTTTVLYNSHNVSNFGIFK